MTERLTDKTKDGKWYVCGINEASIMRLRGYGRIIVGLAIDKLAEYETAEEEGRLVILPCKPGDTVYIIRDDCDFPYDCYQSRTCKKCEYRNLYVDEEVFRLVDIVTNLKLFGITIFLTPEKAEKALEKLQNAEEM